MTVVNLHLEEIREFLIPLPNINEQKLKLQKQGLMHDLLTGKVRVKDA